MAFCNFQARYNDFEDAKKGLKGSKDNHTQIGFGGNNPVEGSNQKKPSVTENHEEFTLERNNFNLQGGFNSQLYQIQ